MVIRNHDNWSTEILLYMTDYAKRTILSPFRYPTWGGLHRWFCFKLLRSCCIIYWWSTYNIHDSSASEYLTTNTSDSGIGKYYVKKMYGIPDFDVSEYSGSE